MFQLGNKRPGTPGRGVYLGVASRDTAKSKKKEEGRGKGGRKGIKVAADPNRSKTPMGQRDL